MLPILGDVLRKGQCHRQADLLMLSDLIGDICKAKYLDHQMIIMFGNATIHEARAKDALSALKMPLHPRVWVTKKQSYLMQDGMFRNEEPQPFYYPENHPNHPNHPGHFKGMETNDTRGARIQCRKT